MTGPSTSSTSGDDLCLAVFADGKVCRREDGHPQIQRDGIGHSVYPQPAGKKTSADRAAQVRELVSDEKFKLLDALSDPYQVERLLSSHFTEDERTAYYGRHDGELG